MVDDYTRRRADELEEAGVKRSFTNWAINYLRKGGIDDQVVDISAEYDRSLTIDENKQLFKEKYPISHKEFSRSDYPMYQEYKEGLKNIEKEYERRVKMAEKNIRNLEKNKAKFIEWAKAYSKSAGLKLTKEDIERAYDPRPEVSLEENIKTFKEAYPHPVELGLEGTPDAEYRAKMAEYIQEEPSEPLAELEEMKPIQREITLTEKITEGLKKKLKDILTAKETEEPEQEVSKIDVALSKIKGGKFNPYKNYLNINPYSGEKEKTFNKAYQKRARYGSPFFRKALSGQRQSPFISTSVNGTTQRLPPFITFASGKRIMQKTSPFLTSIFGIPTQAKEEGQTLILQKTKSGYKLIQAPAQQETKKPATFWYARRRRMPPFIRRSL